tara:strand:- start:35 stop:379 length:345 start_codon:yes stop_codon:yes gene_type:complete
MKLKIKYSGKDLELDNLVVANLFLKFRGLMFRSKKRAPTILFKGEHALHSYFVFFPFLTLWLDGENNVVAWKVIPSFVSYIKPKQSFSKIVEIPLNAENKKVFEFIVGKTFKKK